MDIQSIIILGTTFLLLVIYIKQRNIIMALAMLCCFANTFLVKFMKPVGLPEWVACVLPSTMLCLVIYAIFKKIKYKNIE